VNTLQEQIQGAEPARWRQGASRACLALMAIALTGASAILVKERSGQVRPLAAVDIVRAPERFERPAILAITDVAFRVPELSREEVFANEGPRELTEAEKVALSLDPAMLELAQDPQVRWFDGRPVRPAKQMWMNVSGYSPDERSCGDSADGKTATLHSVFTNGMKLVAADTRVLPFGSLVSIPGYDEGRVVPVLDRGGAIKGNKLDLLFPTHEDAREWGRKKILVTVWEYADGKPAGDPRKAR
jgi:3D (Asp-Asp-Asp) domain-containing protein